MIEEFDQLVAFAEFQRRYSCNSFNSLLVCDIFDFVIIYRNESIYLT